MPHRFLKIFVLISFFKLRAEEVSEEGVNKVKEKWLILTFEVQPNINPHFSKLEHYAVM